MKMAKVFFSTALLLGFAFTTLIPKAHASLEVNNSGTNVVFNDKSVKVANFDENTSWNLAFSNDGFFGH